MLAAALCGPLLALLLVLDEPSRPLEVSLRDAFLGAGSLLLLFHWPRSTAPMAVAYVGAYLLCSPPWPTRSCSRNEGSASGALKTLAAAQEDFRRNSAQETYADSLERLRTGEGGGGVRYIDDALASGRKSGYLHSMQVSGFECPLGKLLEEGTACGGRLVDCRAGPGAQCVVHHRAGAYPCWRGEAHPELYLETGIRSFFIDQTGVLRAEDVGGEPGTRLLPEL